VKRAAQRLGLAHALTGQIAVHDEAFELELALRDLEAGGVIESFRFGGALAQLPGVLDDLPARILAALNVSHPTPRETRAAQAGIPELRALVTALSLPADATRAAQADAVRKLWSSGPRSVLAAAHYLGHVEAPDPSTYLARLDAVRAEFAQDRGLDWLVARMMPARDGLLEEKKRRIAAHVLERPGDPMPMVVLADTLVDNGYALGGVSLMREALLRWPRNYRAWWSTSYACVHYGWELRGTSFWRDVPEPAQRLFPLLREAADRAVDQALARHQELPELWVQKMMTVGQFGEEFMQAYRRAIELDPQNRRAYEMALNYTLPQWGGSREIQDEIWAQARERIHDPAWLEEMQARYRSDESLAQRLEDRAAAALGSFLRPGLALALLAVLALVAALLWVLLRGRAG
jgi:hypothetical protein